MTKSNVTPAPEPGSSTGSRVKPGMTTAKALVIGSGAREHAIAWALSKDVEIYALPGNAGSTQPVSIDPMDFEAIGEFCKQNSIKTVVIGPEAPLAAGIVDELYKKGIYAFGPSKKASFLEASKIRSKEFMHRHGVQTAQAYLEHSIADAKNRVDEFAGKCAVKWDGLAAGKGVVVCRSVQDGYQAIDFMSAKYGSTRFVIEEYLSGQELSIFAVTDGMNFKLLPVARDYKRALDGNLGPNTGGMGAVSDDNLWNETLKKRFIDKILQPTAQGFEKEKLGYQGFLYFGLMIVDGEPYLLEYNVRLGDPETSAVLARLKSSLWDLINATKNGNLEQCKIDWDLRPAICLVLCSKGYPGSYDVGHEISGLGDLGSGVLTFHAGTKLKGDKIVTAGGRILNLVALGSSVDDARQRAYDACNNIDFDGKSFRTDIGGDFEFEVKKAWHSHLGAREQHGSDYQGDANRAP